MAGKVPAQIDGIIAANRFCWPTKKYPAGISADDQSAVYDSRHRRGETTKSFRLQKFGEFITTHTRSG